MVLPVGVPAKTFACKLEIRSKQPWTISKEPYRFSFGFISAFDTINRDWWTEQVLIDDHQSSSITTLTTYVCKVLSWDHCSFYFTLNLSCMIGVSMVTVTAIVWLLLQRWCGYWYSVGVVTDTALVWLLIQRWCGYWYSVGVVTDTALVWLLIQRWCGYWYSVGVVTDTALVWLLIQRWCGYWYSVGVVTGTALVWLLIQRWCGYWYSVGVVTITALVWLLLQRCCNVQTTSEYGVFIDTHLNMKKQTSQTIYQRLLFLSVPFLSNQGLLPCKLALANSIREACDFIRVELVYCSRQTWGLPMRKALIGPGTPVCRRIHKS